MVLRENGDAFEYWNSPSIVTLTSKIHSKKRLSRIGGRLLVWLDQFFKDDPRRLNLAAMRCANFAAQSSSSPSEASGTIRREYVVEREDGPSFNLAFVESY
jgi:hypothetical protein